MRPFYLQFSRQFAFAALLALAHGTATAVTASIFTITPKDAKGINKQEDHFSVVLEASWISRQAGVLQSLLSKAKGGMFEVSGTVTFDDKQTAQVTNAITLDDPKNSMGRSLGFKGPIYPDLPADISQLELVFKIALTEEARIGSLLGALDSSKNALPAEVFTASWLGYAKLVSVVTETLFGTKDTDYPLSGRYRVSMPAKEHYVVIVTSTNDNDARLRDANSSFFKFENQKLYFRDKDVPQEWTYFVLQIKANEGRRGVAQRALGVDTPWATVIETQLNVIPVSRAKDEAQLGAIAETTLTAIQNLQKFLKADRSFSNYDRATGLYYYADNAVSVIDRACKARNIAPCPTDELGQYRTRLAKDFNIPVAKIELGAKATQLQAQVENAILKGSIKNPKGGRQVPLLTVTDMERYLKSQQATAKVNKPKPLQQIYMEAYSQKPAQIAPAMAWDPVLKKKVEDSRI